MSGLPSDIGLRIAETLARRDRAAAAALAGKIASAQASGDATGFCDDLAKLQALAGLPLEKGVSPNLGTLAKTAGDRPLAPDVLARVATVTALAKAAQSPAEVCRAKEAVDALAGDIRIDLEIRKAFAAPKTMGACP